jgi:membrane-bound lytic murein transglycosylase B
MRRFGFALGLGLVVLQVLPAFADERGWSYLIEKLTADGVERARVVGVFHDPRVAPFDGLDFSPSPPRERSSLYRRFLRPTGVAAARRCRQQHADAFEAAERQHGVSANVLAAILYVESGCGRHTGSSVIFYRLARLAMANEPANLQRNLERWTDGDGRLEPATAAKIRARARYLEDTFYPEVRALFDVADRMGVAPLDIRGSGSGAFGYPQFLPRSYLSYGVDADGDGRVSLYDTTDAAASCARYFVGHGWRPGLSRSQRRAAVWQYNRSEAYVDTVLALATRLGQAPPRRGKRSATHNHTRRRQTQASALGRSD